MVREERLKTISAKGLHYKILNEKIRGALEEGYQQIKVLEVNGQRYIGNGLAFPGRNLEIYGTVGNDLAIFMDGATIKVFGNAQDGVANTMNEGEIIIYGGVGDLMGYGMRGGRVLVRDSVGYRAGIHMKEYEDKVPILVIGGSCGDFLGEYIAGGRVIVLGLDIEEKDITGYFCGTGMHGGIIYIRGMVPEYKLGKEVKMVEVEETDISFLQQQLLDFSNYFGIDIASIMNRSFYKLVPNNKRPYSRLYTY